MNLLWDGKTAKTSDPQSVTALVRGGYGENKKGTIVLEPEEALYLVDVRGAECTNSKGKILGFNELASKFKRKKLLARYLTYKDWRDRGLFIRPEKEASGNYGKNASEKYKRGKLVLDVPKTGGEFFSEDMMSIVDDVEAGGELYREYWIWADGNV